MMAEKMSADKSHLLAYLKHTPSFAQYIREFADLSTCEILARVREADIQAYHTCVFRFEQRGVKLETAV